MIHCLRWLLAVVVIVASAPVRSVAQQIQSGRSDNCGEVIKIATHDRTTTRFSLARSGDSSVRQTGITLVLLVGGGGNINLDDNGCPRALSRNVLMRMVPLFHVEGFVTALVEAPSDTGDVDGLAEFRMFPQHAEDLAKVIVDLRNRTKGSVWLLGHSRGTISAANAGVRLSGEAAADGLVLISAMMSGDPKARKTLARQSVFDLRLESVKAPLLVVGHAADNCDRSPAALMGNISARTQSERKQVVTVPGGPINPGRATNLAACEVGEPHDFVAQEAEVAAGIARFILGGKF